MHWRMNLVLFVPMWVPDEFVDNSEMDSPWPSWLEGEENRAYRSPYADDAAWPKSVTRKMWAELVAAWKNVGDADQVFAAMVGGECELSEDEQRVLVLLENLAGALSEETDGSARTVASALANKVHALGVRAKVEDDQTPKEALRDTFAWFLGAGAGGWEYELPTADGLRRSVEEWVGRACNARGCGRRRLPRSGRWSCTVPAPRRRGLLPRRLSALARARREFGETRTLVFCTHTVE